MIAGLVIGVLCKVSPERRRLAAARVLVASVVGWLASHVLLVVLGESSFFNHTVMAISWLAITATAADLILTSDVRAATDDDGDGD